MGVMSTKLDVVNYFVRTIRVTLMNLSETVAANLKRVCIEWDISTRDLAQRVGEKSQKSIWNLLNNEHSPRLSTLEPICKTLMVSPQAVVTPNVDTSLLVSRRLPRLIEAYNRMNQHQRETLEAVITDILGE
jgi:DNA-binding Xre family transcriptional regulator